MTFTTTNWNVPQLATVVTNSDDDAQDIWTVILHTRSDAGLGRAAAIVRVIVDDEDELLRVSGNSTPQYTESATTTVATYAAPWAPGVTWSLSGTDSEHFSISRGGDLSFVAPPDYEHSADDNADNVYQVGVHASDGSGAGFLAVSVTVSDVNEPPDVFGPVGVRVAEGAGRSVGTYTYDGPRRSESDPFLSMLTSSARIPRCRRFAEHLAVNRARLAARHGVANSLAAEDFHLLPNHQLAWRSTTSWDATPLRNQRSGIDYLLRPSLASGYGSSGVTFPPARGTLGGDYTGACGEFLPGSG